MIASHALKPALFCVLAVFSAVGSSANVVFDASEFRTGLSITTNQYNPPLHIGKLTMSNTYADEEVDGVTIGELSAFDAFGVAYARPVLYKTVSSNDGLFQVSGSTFKLVDSLALDFEDKSFHDVTILATDTADASVTYQQTFSVSVIDVVEPPPVGAPAPSPSPSVEL
jgi:hypothetical protein